MSAISTLAKSQPLQIAALLGVGALAFWFVNRTVKKDISDLTGAVGTGAQALGESAVGIATGRNAITNGTAYEGWGIFGTLGAGINDVSGGLGDWAGEKVANGVEGIGGLWDRLTGSGDAPALASNPSSAIQTSSNKPFNAGTSTEYADAVAASPVQAQFTASPWALY